MACSWGPRPFAPPLRHHCSSGPRPLAVLPSILAVVQLVVAVAHFATCGLVVGLVLLTVPFAASATGPASVAVAGQWPIL